MTKTLVIFLILFFSGYNILAKTYEAQLDGKPLYFSGELQKNTENFSLYNVKVEAPSLDESDLYLRAQNTYGEKPLNSICSQITMGNYPYAKSHDGLKRSPFQFFRQPRILTITHKKGPSSESVTGFKVSNYNSGTHIQNLSCSAKSLEY